MKCENCHGTGDSQADKNKRCFICNGTGSVCDVCGEATDDAGLDICNACAAEEAEES